jgi:hypothetical protein
MRQSECEANEKRHRVLTYAKKALVVLIMLFALFLSPFVLPVRAVVRWMQRGTRTEQVTRRREVRVLEGTSSPAEDAGD